MQISMTVSRRYVRDWRLLWDKGVTLRIGTERTVRNFMVQELGIPPEYVEKDVRTIFLDRKPVDDMDSAVVHDGARLALAAALPGLCGITMGRGTLVSNLRSGIRHLGGESEGTVAKGSVFIKLLNLVADTQADRLWTSGVTMEGEEYVRLMKRLPEESRPETIIFGDNMKEPVRFAELGERVDRSQEVFVRVVFE